MTNLHDHWASVLFMHSHHMAIEAWCEENMSERPAKVSEWATHDDIVQVFIKLSQSVLIADFRLDSKGMLTIQQHLHIPLETWNPGSIQGLRTPEAKTRFSHRRQTIYLSSELRVPEWGAALLEEWLLSIRSRGTRPKDRNQRLMEMQRMRLSVQRNLESAALDKLESEVAFLHQRLDGVNEQLAD